METENVRKQFRTILFILSYIENYNINNQRKFHVSTLF